MGRLEWKDEYSVGDAELDAQHRVLIDLINMLEDDSAIGPVLAALKRYVDEHFRTEEKRMEASGYPDLAAHIEQHKAFEEWLDSASRVQREGEVALMLRESIRAYLTSWLVNHIMVSDKAYSPYLA